MLFLAQCWAFVVPGLPNSIRFERRYMEGKSLFERGDYAGALAGFLGAAEIDRGCAALYRQIGLAQGELGRKDEERAAYTTAIAREEHDWRTRALLSDRLRAAGDPNAPAPVVFTRPEFRAEQQRWAWDRLTPPCRGEACLAPTVLDVGGADIGYVRNFHAQENEKDAQGNVITYRWTTDHSYIRLTVPEGKGKLRLVARIHSLAWPNKPNPNAEVRVLIAGQAAGVLKATPNWEEAVLDAPDVPAGEVVIVELLTSIGKPPGEEKRRLGVAVDEVRLERK